MSLIKCPECKNLISDFASICPQCGLPFSHYEKYGFKYNDFLIKDSVLMKYRGKDTKVVLFDGVNEIGQDAFFLFFGYRKYYNSKWCNKIMQIGIWRMYIIKRDKIA